MCCFRAGRWVETASRCTGSATHVCRGSGQGPWLRWWTRWGQVAVAGCVATGKPPLTCWCRRANLDSCLATLKVGQLVQQKSYGCWKYASCLIRMLFWSSFLLNVGENSHPDATNQLRRDEIAVIMLVDQCCCHATSCCGNDTSRKGPCTPAEPPTNSGSWCPSYWCTCGELPTYHSPWTSQTSRTVRMFTYHFFGWLVSIATWLTSNQLDNQHRCLLWFSQPGKSTKQLQQSLISYQWVR